MKYSVITFGCRVNQADSLGFEEELRAAGARSAPPEDADMVVVNTCSVTADQGARQTIRRVARDNPSARIVVTGCQLPDYSITKCCRGQLLSGRGPLSFHNQLPACRSNISSPALADRYRQMVVRENLCEAIDRGV